MKQKLLLAAMILFAAVFSGGNSLKAQTDVTNQYLTNADFKSSSGWTRTGSWDDSDISSGISEVYGGWSSNTNNSYSCKQIVTLPKGVYKLTGYAFYRSQGGNPNNIAEDKVNDPDVSLAYLVADDVKREITTLASPSRESYPDNRLQAAQAFYTDGDYLNTLYFTVNADDTKVSIGYEGTHNSQQAKSWFIAGALHLYKIDINSISSSSPLSIDVLNAGFDVCVNGWIYTTGAPNHGRATNQSDDITDGFFENWKWESYTGNIHQSQSIPNGAYTIKAAAFRDQLITGASDGDAVYVYANDDKTLVSASKGTYYTVNTTVTDETLDYGVKSTVAKYRWMGIDNTSITCTGLRLSYADNLPSTGIVPADSWYAVAIPFEGNYIINSTNAAIVTYTQDGTQLVNSETSTSSVAIAANGTETISNLSDGILYVKASAATTLTLNPSSYTYEIGSASTDSYIQSGKTVTVSWADVTTDDPTATFEVQGTPNITFNGDDVDFSTTTNGFTFIVPSGLTPNANYTLNIPANAFGYASGSKYNEAQEIILTTTAVHDGTYYIATTDETQYISRGGNSNTEAVLDEFGIAANFTTDANNVTTITFVDNNKHLAGGSQSVYNDKTAAELEAEEAGKGERAYWTIAAVSGGYTIFSNKWSKYIGKGVGAESPNYPTVATYADAAYIWKLETPADHATKMGTYKDANAAAVATAANEAGITAVAGKTTVEQLKAVIEGAGWVAKNIAVPNAITTVQEKYQYADSETPISQNLTGLENGIYKVKLSVFKRIADNATTYALYQAKKDNPTAYLFAGNMKAQVPSVMSEYKATAYSSQNYEATSGKNYPNGTVSAGLAFDAGLYTLEVFAYVSDGTLNIGLKNPAKYANANWLCYRDLEVTLYKEFTGDYTGLVSAINTAEATYTIGFENDEYAPYNNVAALTALANAKSMNTSRDALSQTEIDNLTNTLTSATWTANDGDVDAVYNGNFATVTEGANYPKGWTRTNGWGQMQSGVSGEYATAYYNQPGSLKYGATGAYTMPLAANTCYKLTFAYRSHEDNSNNKVTVSVLNGTDGLAATSFPGNGSKSEWKKVTKYFFTGEAGNYVLTLANDGNTWMTGVSITKASSITIDENDTYDNTLAGTVDVNLNRTIKVGLNSVVLPFDMDQTEVETAFGSGSKVYVVSAYNATTSTMTFTTQTDGIKANVPCILEATAANNVFELSNRTLVAGTSTASYGNLSFIGSYAATTTIEASENNYVLSGGQLYYVDTDGGVTMKGTRAYFQVAGSANSRDLSFVIDDGEATEIAEIDEEPVEDGVIYNLAGQVVGPDYKGIAIINGKKVLLK